MTVFFQRDCHVSLNAAFDIIASEKHKDALSYDWYYVAILDLLSKFVAFDVQQ